MTSIQKECDKLYQMAVLKRDGVCQHWHCIQPATAAHHIFGRANTATRYLPLNGIGLCQEHHNVAHGQPDLFETIVILRMGWDKYYDLQRLSKTVVKNFDFKECKKMLRGII